jgi:pilus assembly protein CpaB
MRLVFGLVLVVGVALASFAVYMAQDYLDDMSAKAKALEAAQARATKLVDVVVAKRSFKYGERITRDDMEVIKWQANKVPKGAFNAVVAPQDGNTKVVPVFWEGETRPRALLRSYEPFEPILASKITEPGIDAGINAVLGAGKRAFALKVDVTSGVAGFLRPGDRVDIYWSGKIGGQEVAKLIDTAVRLIAINQNADADRSEETQIARTVTVEGTPQQVAALALAQRTGRLTLSLVGSGDELAIDPIEIDRNALLGIEEAAPAAVVEKERVCTIRTNKGGEIVETVIPCTN